MTRRGVVGAVVAAVALVTSPAAVAAETLSGTSSQKRRVVVRVGDDGRVTFFRIDWVARCRDSRFELFDGRSRLLAPIATSTTSEFGEAGSYSETFRGGIRARITVTSRGTRAADGSWSGTFAVTR